MKYLLIISVTILISLLQGCSLIKIGIAYGQSTENFIVHPKDSRVLYETGAEASADTIVSHIENSIAIVESMHYQKFSKDIKIHVCASIETFESHTTMKKSRGTTIGDKLFLSPKLFTQPKTVKSILTHELSHLHLAQKLGGITLYMNVPSWFQEGLATYVSSGGGAEKISVYDAVKALESQTFFIPDDTASIFDLKNATSYGFTEHYSDPLTAQHMYYRQSSMFVAYLKNSDNDSFNGLMKLILKGEKFKSAYSKKFDGNIKDSWNKFVGMTAT